MCVCTADSEHGGVGGGPGAVGGHARVVPAVRPRHGRDHEYGRPIAYFRLAT